MATKKNELEPEGEGSFFVALFLWVRVFVGEGLLYARTLVGEVFVGESSFFVRLY